MPNEKILVQLNTPILIESTEKDAKTQTVHFLQGSIVEQNQSGLWLKIEEAKNDRGMAVKISYSQIFLPTHKIDHLFKL